MLSSAQRHLAKLAALTPLPTQPPLFPSLPPSLPQTLTSASLAPTGFACWGYTPLTIQTIPSVLSILASRCPHLSPCNFSHHPSIISTHSRSRHSQRLLPFDQSDPPVCHVHPCHPCLSPSPSVDSLSVSYMILPIYTESGSRFPYWKLKRGKCWAAVASAAQCCPLIHFLWVILLPNSVYRLIKFSVTQGFTKLLTS